MHFWRLAEPEYESDYQEIFINGELEHPFGLPGVECNACGATWGGSRILPVDCPPHLRRLRKLTDPSPIPLHEHRKLQHRLLALLKQEADLPATLMPGDSFQPAYLDVPSRPVADFLWSSLGSLVISERAKAVFDDLNMQGIRILRVNLRKIGKRNASGQPPIPRSGEPEDMMNTISPKACGAAVGPYYEVIIQSESALPPGAGEVRPCPECGRPQNETDGRQFVMLAPMWTGAQIFFLATTLCVVITDSVKVALERIRPTNVRFISLEPTVGVFSPRLESRDHRQ